MKEQSLTVKNIKDMTKEQLLSELFDCIDNLEDSKDDNKIADLNMHEKTFIRLYFTILEGKLDFDAFSPSVLGYLAGMAVYKDNTLPLHTIEVKTPQEKIIQHTGPRLTGIDQDLVGKQIINQCVNCGEEDPLVIKPVKSTAKVWGDWLL